MSQKIQFTVLGEPQKYKKRKGKKKNMKKGDKVIIKDSAEEEIYNGCVFEVLSDPYTVCGEKLVKMKCHETGKYFAGGYAIAFLEKINS